MGFFSKKVQPAEPIATVAPPALDLVESPRTLVLSFLHETSKNTGMREFVKNYAFLPTNEPRFVVLIELKDHCARVPSALFMARWQLLQLETMRWAQSKALPLQALVCAFPLDKSTALPELKMQAQLGAALDIAGQAPAAVTSLAANATDKAAKASRLSVADLLADAPESQIEVHHDDMAVAEEFFRLTQPPAA